MERVTDPSFVNSVVKTVKTEPIDNAFVNHQIVTLAVYLLGGETRAIDTEYVAVKAAELAPGRYNWRYYPEQINIELVRTFLSDAKKKRCGQYVTGSTNEGWMLTQAGTTFSRENVHRLGCENLAVPRKSQADKKWLRRERARLLATAAFAKFLSGEYDAISPSDAATFFRLDEYVTGTARERKVARIVNAFHDDPELLVAVTKILELLNRENSDEH
jgi:hypothetical protein